MLGARRAGVTVAVGPAGAARARSAAAAATSWCRTARALLESSLRCYLQDRQTYEQGMGVPPSQRRY